MSKKTDDWMPLLVDKYLGDTGHLNTEQHGAYMLLLLHAWKKEGVLPNDDAQLANICRLTPAKWRAHKPVLMPFFRPTGDGSGLTQKRLSEELVRAKAITSKKAEAGAKGAAKRWGGDGKTDGTAMAQPLANASQSQSQTGTPIPIPIPLGDISERDRAHARSGAVDNSDPPEANGIPPTAAGQVFRAALDAGLDGASPNDSRLKALLDQGATVDEITAVVKEAASKGKGWPWALVTVERRRADAADIALAPVPQTDPNAWTATRSGIEAKGAELGVGRWDQDAFDHGHGETFAAYTERVRRAANQ